MSKFRTIVEKVMKEYYQDDYDDHTCEGEEIEWTLDLPMNDDIRKEILRANLVGKEDLKDDQGNWLSNYELDVIVQYDIDGYPDDEEITVTNIYLENYDSEKHRSFAGADITPFLPDGYLDTVARELEQESDIELHSYDYEGQVQDDYYSMIAPGGKL